MPEGVYKFRATIRGIARGPSIVQPFWRGGEIVCEVVEDWARGDRLEFDWPAKRRRRPAPFNGRLA